MLDAIRGFSLILMLAYHFGYTLYSFGLVSADVIYHDIFKVLQPLFASVFILLCGVSSNFSRSNLKRGLVTLGCAAAVSVVMWRFGMPVWFGILHFLGCCMLIYAAAGKFARKFKAFRSLAVCAVLFTVCFIAFPVETENDWFAWLGFSSHDFVISAADYFPVGRWFFLFMAGTYLGGYIKDGPMPKWFCEFDMPVLPAVGRHTLVIYMVHQPVFYGVIQLFLFLFHS